MNYVGVIVLLIAEAVMIVVMMNLILFEIHLVLLNFTVPCYEYTHTVLEAMSMERRMSTGVIMELNGC